MSSKSFQKKGRNVRLTIPGTKLDGHDLLSSTGSHSLDEFLGGGLAVGSIILIEDDAKNLHSRVLTKHFIAEGVSLHQVITLCTSETPTEILLKDIPVSIKKDNAQQLKTSDTDALKIAWRYQQLPSSNQNSTVKNQGFDWSTFITEEQKAAIGCYKGPKTYSGALQYISSTIASLQSSEQLLRLVIEGLGSSIWEDEDNIMKFLYSLRALTRSSNTICFISSPGYWLQQDLGRQKQIRRLVDVVVTLKVLHEHEKQKHPQYKEYTGLISFPRINRPNTLFFTKRVHNRQDLAYLIKRKAFIIEKLHLPPALAEAPSIKVTPRSMCGSGPGPSVLDF